MEKIQTYDNMGFRITYPEVFENTRGQVMPMPIGGKNGMYFMLVNYLAASQEDLEPLNKKEEAGELTNEEKMSVLGSMGMLLTIIGVEGQKSPEEIIKKMKMEGRMNKDMFIEIARYKDITYYAVTDYDSEETFLKRRGPVYEKEFRILQPALIEALKNAEYFGPRIPGADLIGKTISFETTDIDGNAVNSKELFGSHAVTMINLWATWCGPCKSELEELGRIHRRLLEKDAAIVGICTDGDEKADVCRELMAKNNMTYINLVAYPGLDEQLPTEGIPTSFFVNREGKIMTYPIIGVPTDISEYEKTVDMMLAKAADGFDPSIQNVDKKEKNGCHVIVKDEGNTPIEGVMVQFCSDTTCTMGKTDVEGIASFNAQAGHYTVHVHKVPEGYAPCTEEFTVPDDLGDVEIILKKS